MQSSPLITKSPLFESDFDSISRIIYFASRVRPFSIPLLVRLVFDLSEQSPAFKQAMIDDLFSRQYSNIGRYYFLYKCYEKGLFTIDLVSNNLWYTVSYLALHPDLDIFSPENTGKFYTWSNEYQIFIMVNNEYDDMSYIIN